MLIRLKPTEQERRIIEGKATAQDVLEFTVYHLKCSQTLIRFFAEEEYRKCKARRDDQRRERYWKLWENPMAVFLEDVFQLDPVSSISSQEIYEIYCSWCSKEHLPAMPIRSLCYWLKHKTNNAVLPCTMVKEGKRCRGFRGLRCNTSNT